MSRFFLLFLLFSASVSAQQLGAALAREVVCDANGKIWILGTDFGLYTYQNQTWTEHPSHTRVRTLSIAPNGTLYTIGYDNKMYKSNGTQTWDGITPHFKAQHMVSNGADKTYCIGLNNKIYQLQSNDNWQELDPVARAKSIFLAPNGALYHVGTNKKVYLWNENQWEELSYFPRTTAIAFSQNTMKMGVWGRDSKLYFLKGKSLRWEEYPEKPKLKGLALMPDGKPIWIDYWNNKVILGKRVTL